MKKRFRIDILLALITPLTATIVYDYLYDTVHNMLLLYMSFIAIACEIPFLYENAYKNIQDRGIVSGVLVSSIIAISCIFSNPMEIVSTIISIMLIISGITIRFLSKIYLGSNFSHSIKIDKQHKLVTTGIYAKIRHPAYLGTIFIILGITIAFPVEFCIAIIVLVCLFVEMRVTKEEEIMIKHFGIAYNKYILKTKRYIPYIY